MDLFKERLKIVWNKVKVRETLIYLVILMASVIIVFNDALYKIFVWGLASALGSILLVIIVCGIYWLFIESFRKGDK